MITLTKTNTNTKIINNELIETKKSLTKWERVSPYKACMRVRERNVWIFYGVNLVTRRCYDLSMTF